MAAVRKKPTGTAALTSDWIAGLEPLAATRADSLAGAVTRRVYPGTEREFALQTALFSRHGVERTIRWAFELAHREGRSVTSISKGNAMQYSGVLWDEIFADVSADYPNIEARELLVDAAAMFMVMDPRQFGVVVASSLFAGILTDLGAAIMGGMGLAASANLNPEGRFPSMFEPIHGSAVALPAAQPG